MSTDHDKINFSALLDRPIAFHKVFAMIAGSATGGLFLSQAVYWSERTGDKDGWFYKTREDWFEETMLGRYEQEAARKSLCELGVLEEKKEGMPLKTYYRVMRTVLTNMLVKFSQQDGYKQPTSRLKTASMVAENSRVYKNRDYTETTTEIINPPTPQRGGLVPPQIYERLEKKSKAVKKPEPVVELPAWLDAETWEGFVDHRKKLRAPLTPKAIQLIIRDLSKVFDSGKDPNAELERSIKNGWRGVCFPEAAGKQRPGQSSLAEHNKAAGQEWLRQQGIVA